MDDIDLAFELEASGDGDEGISDESYDEINDVISDLFNDFNQLINDSQKWLENEDNCWLLFGATFVCITIPGQSSRFFNSLTVRLLHIISATTLSINS